MLAKAAGVPCYAVAERFYFLIPLQFLIIISYKFLRKLPLKQSDIPGNAPTTLNRFPTDRFGREKQDVPLRSDDREVCVFYRFF